MKIGTEGIHPEIRQNWTLSVPNLMIVNQIPTAILCGNRDSIGQLAGGSYSLMSVKPE
jgi:hypothetical protein